MELLLEDKRYFIIQITTSSVQPPTAALTRLSKDTYKQIAGIIPRKDISLSYQRNKFSLITHNTRLTKILTNTTNYLHRYDISINSIIETSSAVSVVQQILQKLNQARDEGVGVDDGDDGDDKRDNGDDECGDGNDECGAGDDEGDEKSLR